MTDTEDIPTVPIRHCCILLHCRICSDSVSSSQRLCGVLVFAFLVSNIVMSSIQKLNALFYGFGHSTHFEGWSCWIKACNALQFKWPSLSDSHHKNVDLLVSFLNEGALLGGSAGEAQGQHFFCSTASLKGHWLGCCTPMPPSNFTRWCWFMGNCPIKGNPRGPRMFALSGRIIIIMNRSSHIQ